jgi:hypothetical protein
VKEVLVIANQTLGGVKLLEAVRERASAGDARFRLVVPQTNPAAGLVVYDEAVREAAQVRVDLALSAVAAEGIEATGEVGDQDPFMATMDAGPTRSSCRRIRRRARAGCDAIWSSESRTPAACP